LLVSNNPRLIKSMYLIRSLISLKTFLLLTALFFLSSCIRQSDDNEGPVIVPPADSANYTDAGKGFYMDRDGNLFILTEDENDFDSVFQFYEQLDSIDLETFKYLGNYDYYAKDKNHVYIFQPDACGMNVFILADADPETFVSLNYRWGRDKNLVYESGYELDSLDPDHFYLVNTDKNDPFFDYAYDGKFMYYSFELLEKPDSSIIKFIEKEKDDTAFCRKYEYID
jgi:hypothetical protein